MYYPNNELSGLFCQFKQFLIFAFQKQIVQSRKKALALTLETSIIFNAKVSFSIPLKGR